MHTKVYDGNMTCRWHHLVGWLAHKRDANPVIKRIVPGAHNYACMQFFPQDWYKAELAISSSQL